MRGLAEKQNFKLMAGGKAAGRGKKNKKPKGKAGYKGRGAALGLLALVLCAILGAGIFVAVRYRVQNVTVEGNIHYTREEIIDMVLSDRLDYNSLYLSFKYKNKEIKDIPFIQTMSVKVLSPDTIRITVYEKTVAGYVEYLGRYMYFDRDGIVVESSETRTEGVPQVTGITFDHMVLYEPLPVEDAAIFGQILSITQILSKYDITTDKIYFNESYEITLYFDKVRVRLGDDNLEEKIMRLQYILPQLEGKSGILQMENYDDESENVTFKQDGGSAETVGEK